MCACVCACVYMYVCVHTHKKVVVNAECLTQIALHLMF